MLRVRSVLLAGKAVTIFFNDNEEHSFTHHWSVHVPESSLLTVQNLPLNFVSFLVHSREKQQSRAGWQSRYEPVQRRARTPAGRSGVGFRQKPTLLVLLLA